MISMPTVCSVQTVHLSCTDTNTVSKWTKTRFHTTHVTYKFYRVRLKLFTSLWYVQCKPCTYLATGLALSPYGQNRARPDPHHLGVPSGASKMIYEPMVCFKTDQNEIPHVPHHLGVSTGASNTIFEPTLRSTQTVHQSCIKSCTISKRTEPSFNLSLDTKESHRVRPK
jgi:hypothetical protein